MAQTSPSSLKYPPSISTKGENPSPLWRRTEQHLEMMTIKSPRQNILPDNGVNHSTRNIVLLGLVSFFADLSTEMVYPLIPVYLVTIF
ncbi:MAG: hypothetical protein RR051_01395, partial [Clostridiales bacterium]